MINELVYGHEPGTNGRNAGYEQPDFAGKAFELIDKLTGEITTILGFAAVRPYSQYIYAEGMISSCEPQWIDVNKNVIGNSMKVCFFVFLYPK